ncbi:KipI antagonist [Clostridium saccharobutylicum]|uniref:5-oxoprolinase subunit C family protein n=1 Tax=Clostridium saccharobutylicum TaxID=169679 RepID=UPI000983CAFC|nr:biotin-dependent carboxyltransferase family protein [Clostridium saccharobutylicum]AQS10859.1 KipI antagonist [Clostridium saccharobutylicum]MBC2436420.1 biotin-dependent carboxyltransferase family protein [Clostridium saccharobutylicum]NSB88104.1 antagonist of KipI [Clostridium saccharobutylicum]NYC31835.1 antagonist of KipI [Clostridium saccharobutylicum]OOM19102.1 KipI antagonist [Clostridium saccharobutylicum]
MNISVLNPGLLTTIQDLGRIGYQKDGVIVSGAMDSYAMRLSNIIVGNEENESVLEITLVGPSLQLNEGTLFAITGADLSPTINGLKVPSGRPVYVNKNCTLKFGSCKAGCRSYLAVAGGFDVPKVMNSKSTYLRAGFGGYEGRALKKGDILRIGVKSLESTILIEKLKEISDKDDFVTLKWYVKNFIKEISENTVIRVFSDRQFHSISEESIKKFFDSKFNIDARSDRMGYRLCGEKIQFKEKLEMISEEVSVGTIQVPPDGNPIILLADRQTAGGYPKIAHVASVDIQKIVQLKPNDKIIFKKITLKEAEKLYFSRERYISEIKKAIKLITI